MHTYPFPIHAWKKNQKTKKEHSTVYSGERNINNRKLKISPPSFSFLGPHNYGQMCVHICFLVPRIRLCLGLATCDSFLLPPPPLEVVLVPTSRRCNLSPPRPSDAASHYFLWGGGEPCVVTGPNVTAPPYTKVSHTCVPRNVWLSRKETKEKIFFRGTNSISLMGNVFFIRKRKSFCIFGECHTLLHASWSFERRREEEGLSSASAALLRFSLPPSFSSYQKTSYYYNTAAAEKYSLPA